MPPRPDGIHHLKLPVADLGRTLAFFTEVLAADRLPTADHVRPDGTVYAHVLRVPGLDALLELRLDAEQARAARGSDPVTFAVADRAALHAWITHLDGLGIGHSPVLAALTAWLVVFDTPDGLRLRLMTRETHGPDVPPDTDDPWVRATPEEDHR